MTYAALKYDVSAPDSPLPAAAVRRWLHGRWALLFSHPDDFASYGFESDRWLVHVQEAFAAADIRPLALAGPHEAGWVTEVGGCTTTLALDEIQRYPVARDSREEALRCAAFGPDARFVMTLDAVTAAASHVRLRAARPVAVADGSRALARGARDGVQLSRTISRGTPAIPCRR